MAATITQQPERLNLLKREGSNLDGRNLGGVLAMPLEFNCKQFAAQWSKEGNEVAAAQGRQFLAGSVYSAEGWEVWKYPDEQPTGKTNKEGNQIMVAHPKAGQMHKVTLAGKEAGTYVLLFRPIGVQVQVNEVFGMVSRERMLAEISGSTLDGAQPQPGMLTNEHLTRVLGAEVEVDSAAGRSPVIHTQLTGATHLSGKPLRVTR